jgi:hypothetical protein
MDVFGSVADLYDTARPPYPRELADAIVAYHGGLPPSVAEIGAGTGKGTEVLATLGALIDTFGGTVVMNLRTTLTLARPYPADT